MSEKYKWQGVNISDITNTTSINSISENKGFMDFPANYTILSELSQEPDGFVSNSSYSNLPVPNNGYYCYTEDEDEDAPPFKYNGQSLFTLKTSNNRIVVKNDTISSGNSTITIPEWCNAIKVYFISIKGSNGTNGSPVNASNYNVNYTNNYNSHYDRDEHKNYNVWPDHRNFNKDDHHHYDHKQNEHRNEVWSYAAGGSGGSGGKGKIGYFPKLIKFTAGSNNKLVYSINTSALGSSNVQIKENNTTVVANVTFVSGGNGGNGGNAETGTTENNNYNTAATNYHTTGDHNVHTIYNNFNIQKKGSKAGDPGAAGTPGSSTIATTDNITYLHYNNSDEASSIRLKIYYFKY